ncbi:MAG: Acyltransferase family protein [Bacteroidetes bacterium ADurb.Bin408]|nr:MAG: Acyltransferase family protein [Bacteroidetes bacterium ADurb.Bin408]
MTQRLQTFDLLKGVAVILMIQVHLVELFATPKIYESMLGKILLFLGGPPVAPVFLFIFGFFIARGDKTVMQLLKRAGFILLTGLLLNILLNLNFFFSIFKGEFSYSIWPYVFGVDILINASFSLLFVALLRVINKENIMLYIILALISAFMGRYLLKYTPHGNYQYLLSIFYGASKWSYFPLFPWLAYTLSGYAFCLIRKKNDLAFLNNVKGKIITWAAGLVFLLLTLRFAVLIASNLPLYYHHGYIFFLWVIIFMAFYGFVIDEINRLAGRTLLFRYLRWLGENVTLIYIIQWLIIGNTATAVFRSVSSPWILLLSFAGVLLVSSLLAYAIRKSFLEDNTNRLPIP